MNEKDIKNVVKKRYGRIAKKRKRGCCGGESMENIIAKNAGYSVSDLKSVPEDANMGLGCGNPTALADIREGDTVLDLGSGGGFDCFLASKKVGPNGKVIGVDMTKAMIRKAQANAKKGKYSNVEFRQGEIEQLPVDNVSVDLIISNCVINLSSDKEKVFREAYRVLKPGGKMLVSDMVLTELLPEKIKNSAVLYSQCVSGALLQDEYIGAIRKAGFQNVEIISEATFSEDFLSQYPDVDEILKSLDITWEEARKAFRSVKSIKVSAAKPAE